MGAHVCLHVVREIRAIGPDTVPSNLCRYVKGRFQNCVIEMDDGVNVLGGVYPHLDAHSVTLDTFS